MSAKSATKPEIRKKALVRKRKEPELTPAEQHKRFKEVAKKAGVTKKEEEFEWASRRVAASEPTKTGKSPG